MSRRVQVIGAPYGHGGVGEGCKRGPTAIRDAGLADRVFPAEQVSRGYVDRTVDGYEDAGDLTFDFEGARRPEDVAELIPHASAAEIVDEANGSPKVIGEAATMWEEVADAVAGSIRNGAVPLVLGGDHTIATGTMQGASRDAEIGVVWFDAHGDFNTPLSTPSGNVHGMPLAAALGRGAFRDMEWAHAPDVVGDNVAVVGLRDLDHDLPERVKTSDHVDDSRVQPEAQALADSDVTTFTMADIDERGLDAVVREALDVATAGVDGVHVSVDLDWLDESEVPGVGTPVEQGATRREARRSMELLAERDAEEGILRSIEFVEVNPRIDEGNRTAEITADLAGAAFGKQFIY